MRSAELWRDLRDTYWRESIWLRTAQYTLTCGRHAEAFTQPTDSTTAR